MKLYPGLSPFLVGAVVTFVQVQPATALTANEVNRIATEVTVLIDGINPGSGVIVAREGQTYFVLTAKHVVATEDEYIIVTKEGRRYPLNYQTVKKIPGVDLALLQFTSDQTYAVATLANYDYDAKFKYVFVSGWPTTQSPTATRQRLFRAGLLISNDYTLAFLKDPVSEGYELFYTNITEVGMSGAPVLDTQGRVIGIHGSAEGEKIYNEQTKELLRVKLGFSAGIPINKFLQARLPLKLRVENTQPPSLTRPESRSIEALLRASPMTNNANVFDWANRGNELYRLEQFEEALTAFNRAIQMQSDFYPAWYGRANVLASLERYEEAIAAYDRATQINPNFYLAWRDRGAMLAFLKRYSEALASFDRALQLKPDDYVAWYIRGDLLAVNLRRSEDAMVAYDRAIRLKPDFAPAWTGRGEVLYLLKRYQEAMIAFDRAIQADPKYTDAWTLKGTLLLELERYSEALLAYEQGLKMTPDDAQLWMLKAATLVALKRDSEARRSAQQALKLQPNDPDILQFIKALAGENSTAGTPSRPRYQRPNSSRSPSDLLW